MTYLKWGSYQIHIENYLLSGKGEHPRIFQYKCFTLLSSWLDNFPLKDAIYCLLCYLFSKKPIETLLFRVSIVSVS